MVRHGEPQARDDHVRERFARNIDTAPKTIRTEEHAAWRGFELFEQFAAWRAAPLREEVHFLRHEKFLHLSGQLLQIAIAREQDKGTAVRLLDKMCDPMFQFFLIPDVARVGHFLHDEDFHLLLKVERTPKLQWLGLVRADARPEIRQIGAADRERGAGPDAAAIFPEK